MGINASLTTFSSGATISSSAVNSNFSSLNNAGLSSDSGTISTSGGGIITCTGLIIGNSQHIKLGTSSTIQFTNGATTNDVFYVETASGHTDVQTFGSSGQIRFKDSSANTFAFADPGVHGFSLADGAQVPHAVLYNNTGSGELYIQMSGSGNLVIKDNNGNNMAHIDHSGNMVLKGTLTQSGTP